MSTPSGCMVFKASQASVRICSTWANRNLRHHGQNRNGGYIRSRETTQSLRPAQTPPKDPPITFSINPSSTPSRTVYVRTDQWELAPQLYSARKVSMHSSFALGLLLYGNIHNASYPILTAGQRGKGPPPGSSRVPIGLSGWRNL